MREKEKSGGALLGLWLEQRGNESGRDWDGGLLRQNECGDEGRHSTFETPHGYVRRTAITSLILSTVSPDLAQSLLARHKYSENLC